MCAVWISIADLKSILCHQEGHAFTYSLHYETPFYCFHRSSENFIRYHLFTFEYLLLISARMWVISQADFSNTYTHTPYRDSCIGSLDIGTHVLQNEWIAILYSAGGRLANNRLKGVYSIQTRRSIRSIPDPQFFFVFFLFQGYIHWVTIVETLNTQLMSQHCIFNLC